MEFERGRTEREPERSLVLHEVSNKVAAAQDTDGALDLIVNEAAQLLGATGVCIRLLEGGGLVPDAGTETASEFLSGTAEAMPTLWVV